MKKIALILTISILLLSATIAPAMAGPTDVTIQVGDWFKYEAKVTQWISEDPFLPDGYYGPLTLADNQTTSIVYTVTEIVPTTVPATGKNVTFAITYNWKNGTVTTGTLVEHISTMNQNIFMIGANMNAPDKVSDAYSFFGMADYPQRDITRTFDRQYPSGTRATNECNITVNLFSTDYDYAMQWDKATGVRVYYKNHAAVGAMFSAAYEYTLEYNLVDSSVTGLQIPETITPILLLLLTAAVIVGARCLRKQPRFAKLSQVKL